LNIADWKYRDVLKSRESPVESINVAFHEGNYHSYTKLKNSRKRLTEIYGHVDGTGSDIDPSTACHKSISEAMESWAYYDLINCNNDILKSIFGLNIDSTSAGFAAYPCLFVNYARKVALLEAQERWSLDSWWQGYLNAHEISFNPNVHCIEVKTPFKESVLVVCWKFSDHTNGYVYGFSAKTSVLDACNHAQVEMLRNESVLSYFFDQIGCSTRSNLSIDEKRLLYFASPDGYEYFSSRVKKSTCKSNHQPDVMISRPNLLVDFELVGPWLKYATVWRALYEPVNDSARYNQAENYFLF
jgi:hypothetical protein